jgi:ABC-type dipeptide/oligopeptide/nickel transport system permease component
MGYVFNHLATLVCGVFAAVLTLLWPMFVDYSAVFDLVFMLAVPIMWFLTIICFVAQKSADYMHGSGHKSSKKSNKKLVYTSDGIASKQNNH